MGFSIAIAFGVGNNTARVALSERARELASLRVLGFTRVETSRILLLEQAALLVAALPLGFVVGYGGVGLLVLAVETELYRLPFVMRAGTYAYAVVVVIAAALISALIVRRRIDRRLRRLRARALSGPRHRIPRIRHAPTLPRSQRGPGQPPR